MKIYHWFEHIRPGGGPSGYGYNLFKAMTSDDNSNVEVLYRSSVDERVSNSSSNRYNLLKKIPTLFYLLTLLRLLFFKKNKVFFSYANKGNAIIVHDIFSAASLSDGNILNTKKYAMIHSPKAPCEELLENLGLKTDGFLKYLGGMVEIKILKRLDGIIAPSEHAYEAYYTGRQSNEFNKIRKIVVPSAVYPISTEYKHKLNLNRMTFGYLGRYNYDKGFDLFLNLAKNNTKFKFLSAGSGVIKPSNIENYTNIGWINNPLEDFFSKIDVLVVPNRIAYFDLVILEALSLGIPVITTKVGGSKDLDRPGVFLVSRDKLDKIDLEKLSSDIINSFDNSIIKQQFEDKYSLGVLVKRYQEVAKNEL